MMKKHKQTPSFLQMLIGMVIGTRQEELSCDECFEQVDRFAEMMLEGKNAAEALPLVEAHLQGCAECKEEFEALLTALRAQLN
jgi:hypothetical protein